MTRKPLSAPRRPAAPSFGMAAVVEHLMPVLAPHGFRPVTVPSTDASVDHGVDFEDAAGRRSLVHVQVSSFRTYVVNKESFGVRDMGDGWSHAAFDGLRECPPGDIRDVNRLGEVVLHEMTVGKFALDPTTGLSADTKVMTDLQTLWVFDALSDRGDIEIVPSREDGREVLTARKDDIEVRFVVTPETYSTLAYVADREPVVLAGEGFRQGRGFNEVVQDYLAQTFDTPVPAPRP